MSGTWSSSDLPFDATGANKAGSPAEPVGPNGFLLAPPPPAGVPRHHGSRWKGDSVTLGRTGRIVATVVLFVPVAWMIYFMGVGGVLFLGLYSFVFLPVALRDVWRRTRVSLAPVPSRPRRAP